MEMIKKLIKHKLFWVGILIPLVFQLVYFLIAIPAIKDGNSGVTNLRIAIVNEDNILGSEIAAQLPKVLPFKTELSSNLTGALDSMNNGDYGMVINIPGDFTANVQKGSAQISYYINQAAPSMTKQIMEKTALSINQILNENVFNNLKNTLKQNVATAIGQAGLTENLSTAVSVTLAKAFESLKYTIISSDIQKVNNAEGFIQTVFPFFIFLMYFVSCIIITILHTLVFNNFNGRYSKAKIFLLRLGTNIGVAILIPCVVIGLATAFDIPFNLGTLTTWMMLSVGFFSLVLMIQMFSNWFGIPGIGVAAVILFPLQLVSSGLIYSREILPSFYSAVSDYLPSTYFGTGMLKIFYGGPSISEEINILLLMAAICVIISALAILKKTRKVEKAIKIS